MAERTGGPDGGLRGPRPAALLAELAAAPGVPAAAQCLTDTLAATADASRVLLYVLDEGEAALRLLAATPRRRADGDGTGHDGDAPARVVRDDGALQPLFA